MRGLDHEISRHLHDVGAPIELLRENRGRRKRSNRFPHSAGRHRRRSTCRASRISIRRAQPLAATVRAGRRAYLHPGRRAPAHGRDDQPVNIELELHQELITKAVDEIGGIRSAAHMADLHPRPRGIAEQDFSRFCLKTRQLSASLPQNLVRFMPGTSSVEMLEGKSQHRALVRIGELQRLALDLACDLVAQHCSAERRQLSSKSERISRSFARQALSAVAVRARARSRP